MRKIVLEIAPSVDGYIEGPDGELDWVNFGEESIAYANKFLSNFDTIFFGRKAYENFGLRSIEESQSPGERLFYEAVNRMRKYVFTRTQKHVEGNGMVINDNLKEEVDRIRNENGKDIWLCGGAEIIRTFIDLDLIDIYRLAIQPTALGSGKPGFKGLKGQLDLDLMKTESLGSGVVVLHYELPKPWRRRSMEF